MLFSPIIKKNFKFLSLTFFVFFISCAVNAQDELKQNVNAIIQGEKNIKTEAISEPKMDSATKIGDTKPQIDAPKKTTKKIYKKSKKKKKKIHKIIRKRIIKKVYVIKNDEVKKAEEVLVEKAVEKNEVDESLVKYKKGELNNFQEIEGEYLIEAELKDNCDRATSGQCFRGDKFFQEPYFHYTILTIFDQKVIAEQFFEGEGRAKDKVFMKVKDGEYLIYTKNKNKIFLVVKNGLAIELVVLNGDLEKESKITSKCQYADKLLAFHRLYKTNEARENTFYYSDPKNFKGLIEATIFTEKYQPKTLYSISKLPNKEMRPTQNLNLCKVNDNLQAIERDFSKKECAKKIKCTMEMLEGYGSEGFSVGDKNFSFDDFTKNINEINLNKDQAGGLLEEVSKLSGEDKNLLKSQCFNDKNIDLINCSNYEKCQDYLTVEACEVNYFYDFNKENK
jgi:hypothetical protein